MLDEDFSERRNLVQKKKKKTKEKKDKKKIKPEKESHLNSKT